jgi:hypothetical protein
MNQVSTDDYFCPGELGKEVTLDVGPQRDKITARHREGEGHPRQRELQSK